MKLTADYLLLALIGLYLATTLLCVWAWLWAN